MNKFQVKKDGLTFTPSKTKNKKYDVYSKNVKIVSFGDKRYEQYNDKIGHYKDLNHYDEDRKKLYYDRHGKKSKKYSAKYFSHKYLW